MDVAVMLRFKRFGSTFFTQVRPRDVFNHDTGLQHQGDFDEEGFGEDYITNEVWQDIQAQINPVAPEGLSSDRFDVQDLTPQPRIKAQRAMTAVEDTFRLLANDLTNGSLWLDVRKVQDPSRNFGQAPTAAWEAFRKVVPLHPGPASPRSNGSIAFNFLKTNSASRFFPMDESNIGQDRNGSNDPAGVRPPR
jgi:histidine ammonia-lyase